MRTSSQLTPEYNCSHNNGVNVSQRQDHLVKAKVQKEVLFMVLRQEIGNDISSIEQELMSLLEMHEIVWENRYQQNENIRLYANRIKRYADFELRDLFFPEREDVLNSESPLLLRSADGSLHNTTVDFFGEPVKALPDYITVNGRTAHIVKVKTSRVPRKSKDDIEAYETYVLGLLGEKLFPGYRICVEINHLGEEDSRTEKLALEQDLPYLPDADEVRLLNKTLKSYRPMSNRLVLEDTAKTFFDLKHEQEKEIGFEPDKNNDCSRCPNFNICNYKEPPIAVDIETAVRPIAEIRLTHNQQEAVDFRSGIARINAGAGAGKTLTVAFRIKELLKEGVPPEQLCLITFTNAGADEMTARVRSYCQAEGLDVDFEKLTSTTFNAFCQSIIETHYQELGFTRPPKVIPEEISADRINTILGRYPRVTGWDYRSGSKQAGYNYMNALTAAKRLFAEIKRDGYSRRHNPYSESESVRGDLEKHKETYSEEDLDIIFQMYNEYNRGIHAENKIEFDDQMLLVEKLLATTRPHLFDEIGFRHIIVDEFQDTDYPQIRLLQKMKDASTFESLMCIGDDAQSIFSFRHTSPEYMINFGKYLGEGNEQVGYRFKDFFLLENHRSSANIIEFANKINRTNEHRVEKDLVATRAEGRPVIVNGFYTEKSEFTWIADCIRKDIESGKNPSDIAFLASDRNQLGKMADILTKMGIPSILMNPIPYQSNAKCAAITSFFDSFAYRTTQGYMDYLNAREHGAFRGQDADLINERIRTFAEEVGTSEMTYERFMEYVRALDPEEKDECFQKFIETKLETCQSMDELKDLFRTIRMYGESSMFKRERRYDGVCLTTIHSAKGLEWDNVYYTVDKLDRENLHVMKWALDHNPKLLAIKEELTRLHFVAASRARNECTCAGKYTVGREARDHLEQNLVLKEAYNFVDKTYSFQHQMLWQTKAQEKAEEKEGTITYTPISMDRVRQAVRGARDGEMTPQQIREYEAMVSGAQQMEMDFDYFN